MLLNNQSFDIPALADSDVDSVGASSGQFGDDEADERVSVESNHQGLLLSTTIDDFLIDNDDGIEPNDSFFIFFCNMFNAVNLQSFFENGSDDAYSNTSSPMYCGDMCVSETVEPSSKNKKRYTILHRQNAVRTPTASITYYMSLDTCTSSSRLCQDKMPSSPSNDFQSFFYDSEPNLRMTSILKTEEEDSLDYEPLPAAESLDHHFKEDSYNSYLPSSYSYLEMKGDNSSGLIDVCVQRIYFFMQKFGLVHSIYLCRVSQRSS